MALRIVESPVNRKHNIGGLVRLVIRPYERKENIVLAGAEAIALSTAPPYWKQGVAVAFQILEMPKKRGDCSIAAVPFVVPSKRK